MLKLCGDSFWLLELIFKDCLTNGIFPSDWKKGSIVPVHKKNYKQCLNNYRPISLPPICSKIFEWLIFNEMFEFFIENNPISQHQSGFKPGDSCINQLLSMMVLMSVVYSSMYLRLLMKYCMMVLFSNWNKMAYLVTF